MIFRVFIGLFCLLFCSFLQGQSDNLLKNGESAYYGRDYVQAIRLLDQLIVDKDQLDNRSLVKAHYFRGMSYYNMTSDRELLNQYPEAFVKASKDFFSVVDLDQKGNYTQLVEQAFLRLMPYLKRNAINRLNLAYRNQQRVDDRANYARQALGFAEVLIRKEPLDYTGYDISAQSKLLMQDSLNALLDFQNTSKIYKENPPPNGDYQIAYAYYRSAMIQNYSMGNPELAISTIQDGLRVLEKEKANNANLNLQDYENTKRDLQNFELDLLLKNPSEKAIRKFALAVEADPSNYNKRCAYAGLLEKTQADLALEQYQIAYQSNPKEILAPYNIAALYINQAAEILKNTPEGISREELEQVNAKANEKNRMALPYLEAVYELNPKNRDVITTLLNLSIRLNDTERYQKYKAVQNE